MNRVLCIIGLLLVAGMSSTFCQTPNPNYDEALAKELGADDYGMKSYVLVLLKTGGNKSADQEFVARSFAGHMANINQLVEEGKLLVAGPLEKNDQAYRGIFILTETNHTLARELLNRDPAIKEGLLEAELYDWYGSAALGAYLEVSDKVWKIKP